MPIQPRLRPPYRGPAYRLVPVAARDPTDARFSIDPGTSPHGGRWHPPGSYPTLYTACDRRICRLRYLRWLADEGLEEDDLRPDRRRVVYELRLSQDRLVDAVSDEGLSALGLPPGYPEGVGHDVTQPIGQALHDQGHPGLWCRSSVLPPAQEIALFTDHARRPAVTGGPWPAL